MVWGCMSSHGVGRLHIVSGTVKAMDYIEILQLREIFLGISHGFFRSITPLVIVQSENASQVVEIANGVYGADSVTASYVQFWSRQFRSGIFDDKDAPRTGRPVVDNVDKITEIIEINRHVSSRSISQDQKIDHKTVVSHLREVGFKKKLHVWVPHQLTPNNMMD
ncbi:histone-lysine N-methyltransferase SETMAR [Trichonephila clavipes]|nr:histone-lysine N-methyltransferase SETMAR [Trichonephila clavipes]